MLTSLDKVVLILIILASLLSFVVLYNLSSINVQERERELATLKVLGFYDKEVDNYITRENLILTILGIIPGFILGYYLTFITIGTVEMEKTRFLRVVAPMSYIYSAIISLVFTLIVNFVTHFALKKIDMIESLKSVE
jgi:putative ABC transport system permease protein